MKQSNRNRPMGRHGRFNNNRHSSFSINRNTAFDSSSPAGRARGNAQQLIDKYLSLAKDARSQDDRVMCETYLQYADHYTRLLDVALQNEQARVALNTPTPQVQVQPQSQLAPDAIVSDEMKEQAQEALAQAAAIMEVPVTETPQPQPAKAQRFRRPRVQKDNSGTLKMEPIPVAQTAEKTNETPEQSVPQPVVIEIPE